MLVGLNGASRSGKDSVARILVDKYGFRQVALATAIRKILLDTLPWLRELHTKHEGDWDNIKADSFESVEAMIALGQSCRNHISEDVWLNAAFPTGYHHVRDGNIVVSDIRQPNEVEWLYRSGGELWYVERPGFSQKRGMDGLLRGVSFDAHLINDGTIEELEEEVDAILQQDWVGEREHDDI